MQSQHPLIFLIVAFSSKNIFGSKYLFKNVIVCFTKELHAVEYSITVSLRR